MINVSVTASHSSAKKIRLFNIFATQIQPMKIKFTLSFILFLGFLSHQKLQAQCANPVSVTASPATLCLPGGTVNLNATSTLSAIRWYTVASGGTQIGTSNSAANYNLNVATTSTYYAEAYVASSSSTQLFSFTGGAQTFTVPATGTYTLQTWGAQGGNDGLTGARGGYATGVMTLTAGQVINIYVGGVGGNCSANNGGGFNGGGNAGPYGCSGGGGGASDIRVGGTSLNNRVLVAGGGGGAGNSVQAGAGGGLSGLNGSGSGGTQSAGGAGNPSGTFGQGGNMAGDGGGGGGGWYGGGAAYGDDGGGGGSSYIGGVSSGSTIDGASTMPDPSSGTTVGRAGNGAVKITWNITGCVSAQRTAITVSVMPLPTVSIAGSATVCNGQSVTLTASGATTYTWSNGSSAASIAVAPSSNTTYTLSGRSTAGCQSAAAASLAVTVYSLPILAVSGTNTLCAGQSVLLTGSGANTYTWSNSINTATNSVAPTSNTTYSLNGSSSQGCAGTQVTYAVTAYSLPVLAISGTNTLCVGNAVTLTGSGASTYTWSNALNTTTISVNPATTTSYSLTGRSSNGCLGNTAVVTVTANPIPTIAVAGTTLICQGQTTTLTASGANTYAWSGGPSTAANAVTPATTTNYTVTGTSAAGCATTAVRSVSVQSSITVNVSGTNTLCAGNTVTLTASGATSYVWSNAATTNTTAVTPSSTGSYSVAGTTGVCTATAAMVVTVNANPVLSLTGTTLICQGQTTTLTASGANTYAWSGGPSTATNVVSPSTTTNYTLTGTSSAGCVTTAVSSVSVQPSISVNVSGTNTLCAGGTVTLTANGATSYNWSNAATSNTTAVSPSTTDTYSVTGTTGVCTATAAMVVTVYPNPTLTLVGDTAVCLGATANFTVSGADTYNWSTGATTATLAVTPTAATVYSVVGTFSTGCSSVDSTALNVLSLPVLTLTNVSAICMGDSVIFTASGADTYTWSTGATGTTAVSHPTTNTSYSVVGQFTTGCSDTAYANVVVNALPVLVLTPSTAIICSGESANLSVSGAANYTWNTGANTATLAVTPTITTSYSVVATSTDNCVNAASVNVTVDACTGINKNLSNVVVVYPNPSAGVFTIESEGTCHLVIYNAIGQLVHQKQFNTTTSIDLTAAQSGVYFVRVTNAQGAVVIKQLIKE